MHPNRLFHHTRRTWSSFTPRVGRTIEHALAFGRAPDCPCCGEAMEVRSRSRLEATLPRGASGFDVDCRGCRRFWCIVRHSPRSLKVLRMRRLVAAVRAAAPVNAAMT